MADFSGVANSIEKLNSNNYGNWSIRMKHYLIGQDLWDIVGGESATPPTGDAKTRKEWEMKCGRAMFVLMVAVEDEQMQRIRSAKTPKEVWDVLKTAFAKKNEAKLQRLENELFSISQQELTVSQYFSKVKSLCEEISKLDPDNVINETRMRRIIIHGLRPEFKGLVTATRGWATQPTLDELENILSNEETLDDKMSKVAVKDYEEEALFTGNRGRAARNGHWRRRAEGDRDYWRKRDEGDREDRRRRGNDKEERCYQLGGAECRDCRSSESYQSRKFDGICYNCGKKGHIARYYRSENKPVESHAVITSGASSDEEEWDMEALAILSDVELESHACTVIEEEDWDFEDSTLMITEDEWDISISGETWREANGGIKLELLEIEEKTNEQHVELQEIQGENKEGEEIQVSEVKADQETTKLKQLEGILEPEEESEKSKAQRSSTTRKKAIAGKGEFGEADSPKESCQGMHPEELSNSKIQVLQEQLNIRRRKSVSRGSIEHRGSTDFTKSRER